MTVRNIFYWQIDEEWISSTPRPHFCASMTSLLSITKIENSTDERALGCPFASAPSESYGKKRSQMRCLVEGQKTEKNQPITSSLMPPSSTEANGYSSEYCGFRFNSGVLVIGGTGRNKLPLRSTELLTQWWGEGGGGGSANWQWRPFPPMNDSLPAIPLSVYFQGRVYIVGRRECVDKMEMEMERWQQAVSGPS
ncbi:unnamed protein product [Hymenolepis diminuta]|uniref:Kelch repeat-containing F-box family protein n=1 Tax=Hymenolepis diminuta TaxID=6216 RepID=A0A0R3SX43_HYMDI|nr:unnamed protein product [Hymenolepis diminuta]